VFGPFLAGCLVILWVASFPAPVVYVRYRKMVGFTPVSSIFFMTLFLPGFGQLIYLWYLHSYFTNDNVAKKLAKMQYQEYLEARELFFAEYEEMQHAVNADSMKKPSNKEREESFFRSFPGAKLYIGPKHADDFEFIAESWMKFWGMTDAEKTLKGSDGGIDVNSSDFIGQVKFYANGKVSRPEVQQLLGVAHSEGKGAMFFAYSSGYTEGALAFAELNEVACFTYDFIEERSRFEFIANTESAMEIVLSAEDTDYEENVRRISMEEIAEQYAHEKLTESSFYTEPSRFLR
jgi:hypothetical protein